MTYSDAGRNAVFLYLSSVASLALGYVFWLLVSNIAGAETLGRVAAATAFGWIVSTVAMLGIPTGIQRFLGKAVAEDNRDLFSKYTKTSVVLLGSSVAIVTVCLLILNKEISAILTLPRELFLIAIIMVSGSAMYQLFRAVLISKMKAKLLILADIAGEAGRIILGISFMLLFYHEFGLLVGFIVLFFVPVSILGVHSTRLLVSTKGQSMQFAKTSLETFRASSVSWIPAIITQLGTQMGFLVAFGLLGAFDTGIYFAAFALYSILFAIPSSILSVAYPMMSGMKTGREVFLQSCIKISLVISLPLAVSFMVYASPILNLFGPDFWAASPLTVILLVSLIPATISSAIGFLAYSHGKYKSILVIGLLGSSFKLLLYPLLVPDYGAVGVAMAFLIGSVIALATSIFFAHKMSFRLRWIEIGMTGSIPAAIGLSLMIVRLDPLVGIVAIIGISWIFYLRLGIISIHELRNIVSTAFPSNLATIIFRSLDRIDRFLK